MATTSIWKVNSRLKKVLDYAADENKTTKEITNNDELDIVYNYAINSDKTEKQLFVTGINCIPEIALQEMKIVKKKFDKENKILAYHRLSVIC